MTAHDFYLVTDTFLDRTELVRRNDLKPVLEALFLPYGPTAEYPELAAVIDALVSKLYRGEYYGDEEVYLQITVDPYPGKRLLTT